MDEITYPYIKTDWGKIPDTGLLFAPEEACEDEECECEPTAMTARNAMMLYCEASVLCDLFKTALKYDTVEDLYEFLPPACDGMDYVWLRRFASGFERIKRCIEHGIRPTPTCTGDEMALHLVISCALEEIDDDPYADWLETLPQNKADGDLMAVAFELLEDEDVLMLFEEDFDAMLDDEDTCRQFGFVNLRPQQWFLPFA